MNIRQCIIIFSVSKNKNNLVNIANDIWVLRAMKAMNMPFKILEGRYNGVSEKSYLVSSQYEDQIEKWCSMFNQENYLISYADRSTFLINWDSTREYIGTLERVKSNGKQPKNYSLDLSTGHMWTTTL